MMRAIGWGVALVVTSAIVIGNLNCAASRPVIYAAPDFHKLRVLEKRTAFLIPQPLDITGVVQDYVSAFDGDPKSGAAITQATLRSLLMGNTQYRNRNTGCLSGKRLELIDAEAYSPADSIARALKIEKDEYGLVKVKMAAGSVLSDSLRKSNIAYLIIISCLRINRGSSSVSPAIIPIQYGGPMMAGGGQSMFANMDAQVLVWDVTADALVWNGFVRGRNEIINKFTKNTAKGAADAFVWDLLEALR